MDENTYAQSYVGLAADIVSTYVNNNSLPTSELPTLLNAVHTALAATARGQIQEAPPALVPAVPIKKSITPD